MKPGIVKDKHMVFYIKDGVLHWRCRNAYGSNPVRDTMGTTYTKQKIENLTRHLREIHQCETSEWLP